MEYNEQKQIIYGILTNRIRLQIYNDFRNLTDEAEEDGIIDKNNKYISEYITRLENKYFISQINNINKCIEQMILEYEQDGELEDLLNPEDEWIREYLYSHIQLPEKNNDITLEDMEYFINSL
jgi:hypothetical protein